MIILEKQIILENQQENVQIILQFISVNISYQNILANLIIWSLKIK